MAWHFHQRSEVRRRVLAQLKAGGAYLPETEPERLHGTPRDRQRDGRPASRAKFHSFIIDLARFIIFAIFDPRLQPIGSKPCNAVRLGSDVANEET